MGHVGGTQSSVRAHLVNSYSWVPKHCVALTLLALVVAPSSFPILRVEASEVDILSDRSRRRDSGRASRPVTQNWIIAEGPVLVTPMRSKQPGVWGAWLRLDITGDVGAVLARHVQAKFEIGCQKAVPPNQVAMCTIWYHRTGDGRSSPPQHSEKWKVADTVLGFARVGRVANQWDRYWVEVESPALAQWFLTDEGRDIRCSETTCAFTVMRAGSLDPWTPGDHEVR
jgi:hypothetical protein